MNEGGGGGGRGVGGPLLYCCVRIRPWAWAIYLQNWFLLLEVIFSCSTPSRFRKVLSLVAEWLR